MAPHSLTACSGSRPQVADDEAIPELLHQLFERQAEAHPNHIALVCVGEQLTYGELERRANQFARLLRRRGIGRGECVGLWLPRSLDAYWAVLGILKAGAAYVPLDPDYPAERVRFILSDCQARALVTTSTLADKVTAIQGGFEGAVPTTSEVGEDRGRGREGAQNPDTRFAASVIALDDCSEELTSQNSDKLDRAETGLTPEDLCYIIYTSGTTGRPKGVQIEHRSVCHLVRAEAEIFRVRPDDRVFQGFSLAFDASVEEIWLAFFAGATLVVGTQEMVHAGAGLSRILTEARVTVFSCVPTLLLMLEEDVPSVRLLILGGEACPQELVERWCMPGRRVVNTYGPTEATVIATYAECHPGQPVTIGKPLPNYFVHILDEQGKPVPDGAPGELCLGGIGLARGYVGLPDLTREKFIFLPVTRDECRVSSGEPSYLAPRPSPLVRLYRTGDLARWRPDGQLEFLGRLDTQVKIRGFRVELSEIETVLRECPGVKTAAARLREDVPGQQQLVGYVVPSGAARPDEDAIRACLRARLPACMVPALLETLAELPTLPSGKLDRKSLPPPGAQAPAAGRASVGPLSVREQQLVATWERLFAPLPVSVQNDFFLDLGGHSLLAARMVSELRQTPLFVELSMLDVYRNPTIENLAAQLDLCSHRRKEAEVTDEPGQGLGIEEQGARPSPLDPRPP